MKITFSIFVNFLTRMHSRFLSGFFLFVLFSTSFVFSQSRSRVSGQLTDTDKKPVAFVNLVIKKLSDSSVVKLAVTKEDGRFEFPGIEAGRYFLEGSMVAFRRFRSPDLEVKAGEDLEAGSFMMAPTDVNLKEVNVVATKPFVTLEPDKMVVRVDNNPLMVNSNALEVLRKSPGVMVNQDDQIFMMGKSGLVIYIDGRPSPLSDKDLANWLRTIPSAQIESIELITQPSAKYDAAGNAGIINIRLKKNQKLGMNGSVTSGVSNGFFTEHNYFKQNHSLSLNYGTKKVNFFGSYTFDKGKSWSFMDIYRKQSEQVFDQNTDSYDTRQGHTGKLGADWMISKRHTLSVMADGNFSENESESISANQISRGAGSSPYTVLEARNIGVKSNNTGNINLNHNYKDTSGREITTDANYGWYNLKNRTNQPNFYRNLSPDTSVEDKSFGLNTPVTIAIATLKTDYEQKLKKSILAFGYKVSHVVTDNEFSLFDRSFGQNLLDLDQSSTFTYEENVLAGYASFRHKFSDKWSFQSGLRYEQTVSKGQLKYETLRADSIVKRNYGNLFPSAGISFTMNKMNAFTLSYSRRVDRPVYRFLNPFQYKLDELSYEQGNPFLKPQFTHNVQVNHTFMSMVNTSVGYSFTSNYFARVIDSSGKSSYLTRKNLADVQMVTFNLSSPLPIQKWWNGFINFTFNHQVFQSDLGPGKNLRLVVDFYSIYMQHSISLPKKFTVQVSGSYSSPSVWGGTFKNRHFWFVETGISKKILKDKATISLSVTDLFLSQRWRGRSNFGGIDITVKGGSDSRQIKAGFSWNFGSADIKQIRRKIGNTEERQRLRGE